MKFELSNNQRPIQIVQITDCHLGKRVGDSLLGLDADFSLSQVLRRIKAECSTPDVLLATGDISNDGSVGSYTRFRGLTANVAKHDFWLPGNHDDYSSMQSAVLGGQELTRNIEVDDWQIIMLNSQVPGKVGGELARSELDFLWASLVQAKDRHVLVCLHHHPVPIGCDWLDTQQLANADEFFELLDGFDCVRGVSWGHVHQQLDVVRNGVKLMSSPSTCIQFATDSKKFKLDRQSPGYRWLELHADGQINTTVSRVDDMIFDLDYEVSTGY